MLLLAVTLGGCEHMYGAADVRLSDAEAIRSAQSYAAAHHVSLKGRSPKVERFESGVSVLYPNPACASGCLDGLPMLFFIPAGGRRVTHFQDGRV
jgi:hypothetical protein